MCPKGQSASKAKTNSKKKLKVMKTKMKNGLSTQVQTVDGDHQSMPPNRLDMTQTKTKKNKKLKIGRPIIVEDIIQDYPTLRIPAALRHAASPKAVTRLSQLLEPFDSMEIQNGDGKTKKAKITVAECIRPSTAQPTIESNSNFQVETLVPDPAHQEFSEMCNTYDSPIATERKKSRVRFEPMENESTSGPADKCAIADDAALESWPNGSFEETNTNQLPRFYSLRHKVVAVIEPDGKFCFHGKLRIRVLYGAVRIYGATLNSAKTRTPVSVYSPRAWSPVAVESVESESRDRNNDELWKSLAEQCADRKIGKCLQEDMENLQNGWAVVELENFDNRLTNFLATHCPHHLFSKIDDPSNHSWRDTRRAEIILQAKIRSVDGCKQSTIGSHGIDDLVHGIFHDWDASCESRIIVAGGKNVGKSTTARYLVNKLLDKSKAVLFVDLDPGQAEFTPAGCISLSVVENPLLGPNFTHLDDPYYQLYLGSFDVTRCFVQYIDGVKKLVDRVNDDPNISGLPVVVNTMGFCKGIGWDIINYVIKLITPTDVIQILSKRLKNNFDDTLSCQVVDRQSLGCITWMKDAMDKPTKHQLHVMYSEAETGIEYWTLEAHQQRELVMLAYLSKIVRNDATSSVPSQRIVPSINAAIPYVIPFSAISVALAGAFVPRVLSVMNGNIVALCGVDPEVDSTSQTNVQDDDNSDNYPRVYTRPPPSTCYGFGILRGVDMENKRLFINTPLNSDDMRHVNCLIGCVNLPLSLLQLGQHSAPYTGTEHDHPTSRGSRRGYYRMRYQTDN